MQIRTIRRFTLRTLLVAVTILCVWMGWKVQRAKKQREAIATIRNAVSPAYVPMLNIYYDWQERPGRVIIPSTKTDAEVVVTSSHLLPDWFRNALGEEYFQEVVAVEIPEADDPTEIVRALAKLPELKYVRIFFPGIDDNDVGMLAGIRKLDSLYLFDPQITDKGIEQLHRCSSLRFLEINRADVSEDALEKLKQALPSCEISVGLAESTWHTSGYN